MLKKLKIRKQAPDHFLQEVNNNLVGRLLKSGALYRCAEKFYK
jgi:hypothetical protein